MTNFDGFILQNVPFKVHWHFTFQPALILFHNLKLFKIYAYQNIFAADGPSLFHYLLV